MRKLILISFMSVSVLALRAADTLSLSFETCRKMALTASQDMQKEQNNAQSADFQRREVMAKFFPSAKGVAGVAYTPEVDMMTMNIMQMPIEMSMQLKGMYIAGFMVSQPLFAGGQIVNAYKLTKVGVEAAQEKARLQRNNTIAEVAQAYYAYVAVLGKQTMLREYTVQLDTLMGQVTSSAEIGMSTDAERLRVETAQRQIAYQQKRVNSGIELCRMALTNLLGLNYDSVIIVPADKDFAVKPYDTRQASVDSRPEMQLLSSQIKAAELQKKLTIGKYLPTLGVSAAYTWFGNMYLNGSVGTQYGPLPINQNMKLQMPVVMASLSVPLTDWGGGAYAIKRAKNEVENARLEMDKNRRLLQLEMRQAILNLSDGEDLVSAAEAALTAATEALRIVRERYDVGLSPLTDLLSAQTDWQKAESDYLEAQTQYRLNEVEYLRTTGQL